MNHEAMIYAINSMDCAVAAMKKMRDMLLDLSARSACRDSIDGHYQQDGGPPNMVDAVAQEFGRVLKQYEGNLNGLLDDFASRYISSGILEYLSEIVGRIHYTVDAAAYEKESNARTDPFVAKFLVFIFEKDKVLRDCQARMTGSALVVFIERVATSLSSALMEELKAKRFSEWGALKVRQQVRLLQEQLVELIDGKGTLLPQFARLDQMVTLLNLDNPTDVQNLMMTEPEAAEGRQMLSQMENGEKGEAAVTAASARLTPREIKQILKQRVEFAPGVVDAIVLK